MIHLRRFWFAWLLIAGPVLAEPLTLPEQQRPEWLRRDGIVMAGSWEPLLFRVRRDGGEGYTPTPEQKAAYEREHSPEMVAQLKALGVNFVMMHCYKGGGLEAERESMADAVRFSKLCHDAGLRVGVYNYSGAFIWELFFKEMPQAKDWLVLDEKGQPIPYWSKARYRYYWNRNHPDAQAFYRKLVRFAVTDIQTDLIHFDNYCIGPGSDENSAQRFRQYLAARFRPQQLAEMGVSNIETVKPAMSGPPDNMLRRAWLDFAAYSLADSFCDMSRYARSLRPDILMECNPGGPGESILPPIDHGRLCQAGEAFWDEGEEPGYRDGQLHSRIRTYKIARRMDNIGLAYATTPLEMAESMAFNRDSLGCIGWFEYGKLVAKPGSNDPLSPALTPFISFFQKRRDLLRDARVVADVAVLRSFPSQVFADPRCPALTARVEQTLIEHRVPFQIIFDHQLDDLSRYRVLVLAGCPALSDRQVSQVSSFVDNGGRLCLIGPAGTHDEWMQPRPRAAFGDLPADRTARIDEKADCVPVIASLCPGGLAMSVGGPAGFCAELTEQPGRRLVHLVNYRSDGPSGNVPVSIRLPAGKKGGRVYLVDPQHEDSKLEFTESAGSITTTVPALDVYAIVVATFE